MAESVHDHGLHAVAISDAVEQTARRIARTWSLSAVLLFVVLGFTVGIPHGPDLERWEQLIQLTTIGLLISGVLIAMRREGWGGAILLVGSVSMWGLAALQSQPAVAFLPSLLFAVPAVAFLVAWKRTKSWASLVALGMALAVILVIGAGVAHAVYQRGYGAAHPASGLSGLPETPVVWMWSGAVTHNSATVVVRVDVPEVVTLAVTPEGGGSSLHAGSQNGDVWRFELSGLAAATIHTYQPVVADAPVDQRFGRFRTFAPGPTTFSFAAASCARLGSNGQVYETIVATDPDLFIFTGDMFYADYVETAEHYEHAYESTLTQPAQAHLLANVPIAYVWDDHDYGRNNSDRTMPYRALAHAAFTRNVPHYGLVATDAIYQSFSFGRVQFVLLDDRSHRDPASEPDGPAKSMLGEPQMAWLEQRLRDGRDNYALTVVVNQVPWVAAAEDGADHWGGYTYERQAIADFIATNNISNLLMVSGDAHMIAIDDGTNTDYSTTGNAAFPLLQAAALDRPGSVKGGPYSEGAFSGGGQFGLVEVIDDGGNVTVVLRGIDWEGDQLVEYSYEVPERQP